jgi:hypothetical protein
VSTQLPLHRFPATWSGLVDDAAVFPPGNVPLHEAVRSYVARRGTWYADLVGPFVISDVKLPDLLDVLEELDPPEPVEATVVVSGGAGSVAPAAKWATGTGQLSLRGLEVTLRDPDDLAGNARRVVAAVDAARAEGALDDDVRVYVELPHVGSTASWLATADVVAENDFRLKFRTGGVEERLFPATHALASWIGASLDREVAFKCTAGLHNALRHRDEETGFTHHGFLNVLVATRASLDGADVATVAGVLDQTDGATLLDRADLDALARTRRWFTSFGSCSVLEPLEDLVDLGLVEPAAELEPLVESGETVEDR